MWSKLGNTPTLLVGMYVGVSLWKTVWEAPQKLKSELLCDPAIPLLGIHSDKSIIQKKIHNIVHSSTIYSSQDIEAT